MTEDVFLLRLFGRFRLLVGDKIVGLPTRKAASLFAYLVLNRHRPAARSVLAGMFWPDVPENRARRNLSTTLWRIRKAMHDQTHANLQFSVDGDYIALRCDQIEVDVEEFRSLVDLSRRHDEVTRLEALRKAGAWYAGDFLEDFSDEWCEEERRYLRGLYLGILKEMVMESKKLGDYESAVSSAQRAISLDPMDEDNHRELMLLYYSSGKRTAALAQYETLKKLLDDELGVEPSTPTLELRQQIASGNGLSLEFPSEPLRAVRGLPRADQFPQISMIGREGLIAKLTQLFETAAHGNGVAVIVCGEAGIGKTKLVESLAGEAELRGFEVLRGHCPDLRNPPPFQVFVQALWPRLSALEQLGYDPSSPLASLIRTLVPAAFSAADGSIDSKDGFFDNAIVNEAILRLLEDNHGVRQTLLILEDIHRLDRASERLLISLLGRLARSKLFLVATVRTNEGPEVNNLLSILIRNGASRVVLDRLSEIETKKLVRAVLQTKNVSSSALDHVWQQSEGNPLFILEFLKLLCAERLLVADSFGHWHFPDALRKIRIPMPLRVHEVIRRRMEILDPTSRNVLCSAGVLGTEVDFDLLRQFTSLSEDDLIRCTDCLVQEQLLAETERGFRFPHENIRTVALEMVSRSRVRLFHLRAGHLKERVMSWKTEDLAWHFSEAGEMERALDYAEASGDRARSVHANDDAAKWYSSALEILTGIRGWNRATFLRKRLQLLVKRQEVVELLGDREGQAREVRGINEIANELGDPSASALALYLQANLMIRMNLSEEAIHTATRACQAFCELKDVLGQARSFVTIGLAYGNLRRYDLEISNLKHALSLFRRVRERREEAAVLLQLGRVLHIRGGYLKALGYFALAERRFRGFEDHRSIAYLLIGKGVVYRFLGKMRLSESLLLSGIQILKKIGDRVGEARGLTQLAATNVALGKLRDAVHETRRALRLATGAKDLRAQIVILNNTGVNTDRYIGYFRRGKKSVRKAMALVAESDDRENLASYQDSMAAILLDEGNVREALHWLKLSWASCKSGEIGVGYAAEIEHRLGCAYLELGDRFRAEGHLHHALLDHTRNREIPFQIRSMSALSRLYLERGDVESALKYSQSAYRLLHKVDGLEQVQGVHWVSFQALSAAGADGAAEAALRKAHTEVLRQARSLKGRMRERFLSQVTVNRLILDAARRSHHLDARATAPVQTTEFGVADKAVEEVASLN